MFEEISPESEDDVDKTKSSVQEIYQQIWLAFLVNRFLVEDVPLKQIELIGIDQFLEQDFLKR